MYFLCIYNLITAWKMKLPKYEQHKNMNTSG